MAEAFIVYSYAEFEGAFCQNTEVENFLYPGTLQKDLFALLVELHEHHWDRDDSGIHRPLHSRDVVLTQVRYISVSEFDEIPALVTPAVHGFPQIFKPEVPKRRIYHGMPDTTQAGQLRLDLKHSSLWN